MIGMFSPFQRKVLEELKEAAARGAQCPSNPVLAARCGALSGATSAYAVRRLEQAGLIRVWRFGDSRVVEIVATGQRTAGDITAPQRSYGPGSRPPKGQSGGTSRTVTRGDGARAGPRAAPPREGTAVPDSLSAGGSVPPCCETRNSVWQAPVATPPRERFQRRAVTVASAEAAREGQVHATPPAREGLRAAEPEGTAAGMAPPAPSAAPSPRYAECCWPLGDPGTPGFRFCGTQAMRGKPYCAEHCAIAYVRQTPVAAK